MFYSDRLFIRKIFLLAGDFLILVLALFLALSVRQIKVVDSAYFWMTVKVFLPVFLSSIVIYFLFDLYNIRMIRRIYRSIYFLILAVGFNLVLTIAFFYAFQQNSEITPKTILILHSILVFLLTTAWRFTYHDLFFLSDKYLKKVVIIGGEGANAELAQITAPPRGVDYKMVGYVAPDSTLVSPFADVPCLGNLQDLRGIIAENKVDELVVAFDYKKNPEFVSEFSDSLMLGVKIFEWPVFYEQVFKKVPTNQIDHFWFIYNFAETDKKLYERLKRVADMLLAVVGLAFLAIILPFVAVLIKATSRGPVFYRQKRVGLNGEIFTITKLRTMEDHAEKNGAVWVGENDQRITRVGGFLRKTRIDELPQFFNILSGEMSLIGPRPERPEFMPVLKEKIPFYYKRHMVRPGVTGFAQVMYPYAASVEDSLQKVGYDLYYIKNRSAYLYLKIILLTLRTMLMLGGR
jgi:exopolysaccharide biosynthesis polyprenyl glycosylphosphotransferase